MYSVTPPEGSDELHMSPRAGNRRGTLSMSAETRGDVESAVSSTLQMDILHLALRFSGYGHLGREKRESDARSKDSVLERIKDAEERESRYIARTLP